MNKSVHSDGPASVVQLGSQDELPDHAKLTFFVQAMTPASFPRDQKIEVASNDSSFSTVLRVGEGGIVLQDSKTALVTLDPAKAFGGSAFGPLRFRPISSDGVQGDWQPLATLVRVPQLKELKCAEGAPLCTLVGTDLFSAGPGWHRCPVGQCSYRAGRLWGVDAERPAAERNSLSQTAR